MQRILLKYDFNLSIGGGIYGSPLHLAVSLLAVDIVEILL